MVFLTVLYCYDLNVVDNHCVSVQDYMNMYYSLLIEGL